MSDAPSGRRARGQRVHFQVRVHFHVAREVAELVFRTTVLVMTPPQAWDDCNSAAAAHAGAERRLATDRARKTASCHPHGASVDTGGRVVARVS